MQYAGVCACVCEHQLELHDAVVALIKQGCRNA